MSAFLELYSKDRNFFAKQLQATKKSTIAWLVSHCSTSGQREKYIEELQRYMNVDVYGWCNSRTDPCGKLNGGEKDSCLKNFFNSYKFYIAFENSNCDYYITEKYWQFYYRDNFFSINTVPVVQGARKEQYGGLTFGHQTYIHVDDFNSPKSLADYLLYLDRNDTAYFEYFEWKRKLMSKFEDNVRLMNENKSLSFLDEYYTDELAPFCEICSKLHNETYLNSVNNPVLKITDFFNPENDCRDNGDPNHLKTFIKKIFGKCV